MNNKQLQTKTNKANKTNKTNNTNNTNNTTSKLDRDTNPLSLKKIKPHKKALIILAILLVLDLTVTGFLKFGYTVVRCGGVPYKATPPSLGVVYWIYNTPGHYTPGGSTAKYYCTESEAKSSGATKDTYDATN